MALHVVLLVTMRLKWLHWRLTSFFVTLRTITEQKGSVKDTECLPFVRTLN